MARDRNSRIRSADSLKRRTGRRQPADRVLIVCEGAKTEPHYFEDLRRAERLPAAQVVVFGGRGRTEPRQIVQAALDEFNKSKRFERVYAVFDRDEHRTYADAIRLTETTKLRNEERQDVTFESVASVPCFELWLLLHFEEVHDFFHRQDIQEKLLQHFPAYRKGMAGAYAATSAGRPAATQRAARLKARHQRLPGTEPYTDVHELVSLLLSMSAAVH